MKVIYHRIQQASRSDEFRIIPLGDVHAGNSSCDEALLDRAIERVKNTNAMWIGMGDVADAIGRKDKRYRETSLAPWLHGVEKIYTQQRDWIVERLRPIGDRCLCYLIGNHENYVEINFDVDISHSIVEAIHPTANDQSIYGDMESIVVLDFCRHDASKRLPSISRLVIYCHHGWGGGDLMGGTALKLDRLTSAARADVFLMGHVHKRLVFDASTHDVDKRAKLVYHEMKLAATGTFLESRSPDYPTYAETSGLRARPLGWVEFLLRPHAQCVSNRIEVIM